MREKTWYILCACACAVAISLLLIPRLFPICDSMVETAMGGAVPMRCYLTFRVELLVAGASQLTALTMWFLRDIAGRRMAGFTLLLLAGIGLFVPLRSIIGICSPGMPCATTTAWQSGALVIQGLLGGLALLAVRTPKENTPA